MRAKQSEFGDARNDASTAGSGRVGDENRPMVNTVQMFGGSIATMAHQPIGKVLCCDDISTHMSSVQCAYLAPAHTWTGTML